ncbi:MAG: Rieske (2Fe-2S) protein [Actinobacteria bacterium]|nr:Rieske (2Fe-2S) protein [Actinomycetota bacterium]MCA1738392.1 Rieske (2Fe-2S) protein [Actinomycetota bacterium]
MVGLSSAAASVLSACGGGGQSSGSGGGQTTQDSGDGQTTTDQPASPSVGKGEAIAEESSVSANSAKAFTDADSGQSAVLVHLQSGEYVAYSAVCTHQGCLVNYQPQSQKLSCPCHGSVFDPAREAAVETGPARAPLPKINTAVQNGEVVLT